MKKILSIFLVTLYLAASSGLALHVHYCMDKVAGFTLGEDEQGSCGKCGMEKKSGSCCKDELKFVKLEDAHKLLAGGYQLDPPFSLVHNITRLIDVPATSLLPVKAAAYAHAPPGTTGKSLNILHCIFRV